MKYEKTQKGNPHNLTIKQHTFPYKSIQRFVNDENNIDLFMIDHNKRVSLRANNEIFCAKRVWDQKAEMGYMKEIEDKYQELADLIISSNLNYLTQKNQDIITDMFILWNVREYYRKTSMPNNKINGILDVATKFSKDDEEKLEKAGIYSIKADGTIPKRYTTSIQILQNIRQAQEQMKNRKWGILVAKEGEFICPDNSPNARILVLSPKICFFSQCDKDYDTITKQELRDLNKIAILGSHSYYFARDLTQCPI